MNVTEGRIAAPARPGGDFNKSRRPASRWRRALLLGSALALCAASLAFVPRQQRRQPLPARRLVPLPMKLGYAAFVFVLVPVYWRAYGPSNFLWLSDLALFGTTAAVIVESPLLTSMATVGVLPLELAWNVDFATRGRLFGLASYMFDPAKPPGLRALSLFHVALPPTLLWLLRRLGYDRRAFLLETLVVAGLLPITYAVTEPRANINWVFGPGPRPQHLLPALVYLALEMAAVPLVAMWPTHRLLKRLFDAPSQTPARGRRFSSPEAAAWRTRSSAFSRRSSARQ